MHTKALSDFVCLLNYKDLPAEAVTLGKMCVLDLLGAALAGTATPQGGIWLEYYERAHAQSVPCATAWTKHMERGGYREVAAMNAALSHLLDVDDLHNASIMHLGTVTIPAAISVGQALRKSGKDVLLAIVAGYEAGARVGEAINPAAYYYWHTTGVAGGFCAAVATAKLMRLNAEQMLASFGSAGTQAAGLWEFLNDGAMSKALHTANATLCGIRSAELSALGLTAATRILEGEKGYVKAHAAEYSMERLIEGLGSEPLKILGNSFKPYGCCRHIHSGIACVQRLRQKGGFSPYGIASIVDHTYGIAIECAGNPTPATPYAHKFSIEYCLAAALIHDQMLDTAFTEERLADPIVKELMAKVTTVVDPELDAAYREDSSRWGHRVEIVYSDGRVLSETVIFPPGDFRNPFDWQAVDSKFLALTQDVLPASVATELSRRIRRLDELADIGELFTGMGREHF